MQEENKKIHDPEDTVTITLTREQWHTILNSLKNESDSHFASVTNWLTNCANKAFGSETAASYERAYKKLDALHAVIERVLAPPPEITDPNE